MAPGKLVSFLSVDKGLIQMMWMMLSLMRKSNAVIGICMRLAQLAQLKVYGERVRTSKWIARDGSAIDYGPIDSDVDLYDPEFDELFLETDDPDDEDYKKYTGNEGPSCRHIYRRALLVLWPRSLSLEHAQQAGVGAVASLLKMRLDEISSLCLSTSNDDGHAGQDRGSKYSSSSTTTTSSTTAVHAEALAALGTCLQLIVNGNNDNNSDAAKVTENSNNDNDSHPANDIPLALQQGARAVNLGLQGAADFVQKLVTVAISTVDAPTSLTDPALAASLAEAVCVLDSAAIERRLQQLIARCMVSEPDSCITLVQGVSGQHDLQVVLAATALSYAHVTMVEELLALALAVPDLPVVQQHVVQKLIDGMHMKGPHAGTVFEKVVISLHKLDKLSELQQQLTAAAVLAVTSLGLTKYLSSCPQLIRACRQWPELQGKLVHAVVAALRSEWPWQASMAVKLLEMLPDSPGFHDLIRAAIADSIFSNSGLLECQTDDSMLQLSGMFLSNKHLEDNHYRHFGAAVKRPDSYALMTHLLGSSQVQARLLTSLVQQLVECQVANLECMIAASPMSWRMPLAKFTNSPELQTFLRGPNKTLTVGGFQSFWDAEKAAAQMTTASEDKVWRLEYGLEKGDCSFTAKVENADKGRRYHTVPGCYHIIFTKTKHWHERLDKVLQAVKALRRKLVA